MKTWPGIGNIDWHRLFGSLVTDLFTDTLWRIEREKDLSIKKQFLDLLIVCRGDPFSARSCQRAPA